jgi:hypothetical protein
MELARSLGCCWWGYRSILHAVWTRTEANPLWSELHTDERWVISIPSNSVVGANLANSSQLAREGSAGKGTRPCRSDVCVWRASAMHYVYSCGGVLTEGSNSLLEILIVSLLLNRTCHCLLRNVTSVSTLCFPAILGGMHFHLTKYLTLGS